MTVPYDSTVTVLCTTTVKKPTWILAMVVARPTQCKSLQHLRQVGVQVTVYVGGMTCAMATRQDSQRAYNISTASDELCTLHTLGRGIKNAKFVKVIVQNPSAVSMAWVRGITEAMGQAAALLTAGGVPARSHTPT